MGPHKTSQACEVCRSLKVRCLPSSEPNTCQKCAKSKRPCVFLERPPRQRQARPKSGSKARICALESKVDDLLALASQSHLCRSQGFSQPLDESTESEAPTSSSSSSRGERGSTIRGQSSCTSSNPADASINDWGGLPRIHGTSCTMVLLECGLSIDTAERFLKQFHTMTSYFPFVALDSDATILDLCKNRPFALVAALTAAASADRRLQKSLGEKFRTCALHAIMIENERSLDLLNGILIYLAWYQFHYVPSNDQFNQLLHIAIGMIDDMGLNLRPAEAMKKKATLRLAHYRKAGVLTADHDEFFSREARRAYLGCFYISSVTCWATMKTNGIRFQSYMVECARSLGEDLERSTDALLLPLIQLQHLAEVNHYNFTAVDNTTLDHIGGLNLETKVQSFQAELSEWKQSLPLTSEQSDVMASANLICDLAAAHVFEMGVIISATVKMRQAADYAEPSSSSFKSQIHLEVLFLCLKSAEQFVRTLLSIPTSEYHNLSYIQWSGLIYTITIIYRLTVGIPHLPEWDVRVARKTIDFDCILDVFCCRFNDLSLCDYKISGDEYLFSMMGLIFEDIQKSYDRLKQLPQKESARDTGQVHATSFLTSTPEPQRQCPMSSTQVVDHS
ncbi:unnamed protein product [Penicillium olsonii]|nr:unnamed protein product [Penicillium olsonii]